MWEPATCSGSSNNHSKEMDRPIERGAKNVSWKAYVLLFVLVASGAICGASSNNHNCYNRSAATRTGGSMKTLMGVAVAVLVFLAALTVSAVCGKAIVMLMHFAAGM